MVFPLGSAPGRRVAAGRGRRQRLHVPRVRPDAVRGARAAVPAGADRVAQHHEVPARAGRPARARSRAVHRAREAQHDQAGLGPVALGHAGFLRHRELRRSCANETYNARRAATSSKTKRMGLPCHFADRRASAGEQDRQRRSDAPALVKRQDAAGALRQLQRAHLPRRSRRRAVDDEDELHPGRRFRCAIIRRAHRHAVHGLRRGDLSWCRSSATRSSMRCSTSCRSAPTWTRSIRRRRASPTNPRARGTTKRRRCFRSSCRASRCSSRSRPPSAFAIAPSGDAQRAGEDRVTAARVARSRDALRQGEPA